MKFISGSTAVLVLAGTLCALAAKAQSVFLDLSPQTSPVVSAAASAVGASTMRYYTRGHGSAASPTLHQALVEPPARPSPAAAAALGFTRSPAVTQNVNQKIVTALAPHVPPDKRPRLKQIVDSGELMRSFADLLGQFGYSPDNLGDVMTAYVIMSWETIHNGDATRFPQGIAAVHERVRAAMAMLNVIGRERLLKNGDTAGLRALEQNVRQQTRDYGLDLGDLALTSHGFVRTN